MFDSAAFPLSMTETGALDAPRSAPSLTVLERSRNRAIGLVRNIFMRLLSQSLTIRIKFQKLLRLGLAGLDNNPLDLGIPYFRHTSE